MTSHYKFFQHKFCEYFPCHEGANPEIFNCLFCYCPLYALGNNCGGNYEILPSGIKDCSKCLLPHSLRGYDHVISKIPELYKLIK